VKRINFYLCASFLSLCTVFTLGSAETPNEFENLKSSLFKGMQELNDAGNRFCISAAQCNFQPGPKIDTALKKLTADAVLLQEKLNLAGDNQSLRQEVQKLKTSFEAAKYTVSSISEFCRRIREAPKEFPLCTENQYYAEYLKSARERIDAGADLLEEISNGQGNLDDYGHFIRSKGDRRVQILHKILAALQAQAEISESPEKRRPKLRLLPKDSKPAAEFSEYVNELVLAARDELSLDKASSDTPYDKLTKLFPYKLKVLETESELAEYESRDCEIRNNALFKHYAELMHGLLDLEKKYMEKASVQMRSPQDRDTFVELREELKCQERECAKIRSSLVAYEQRRQKIQGLKKELEQFSKEKRETLLSRMDELAKGIDENTQKLEAASFEGRRVLECEAQGMIGLFELEMDFVREEIADEAAFSKAVAKLDGEKRKKLEERYDKLNQERDEIKKQARLVKELENRIRLLQLKAHIVRDDLKKQRDSYDTERSALSGSFPHNSKRAKKF